MFESLLLKTMAGQSKMMKILCLCICLMLFWLEKHLIKTIQAACSGILNALVCASQTLYYNILQEEKNVGTTHYRLYSATDFNVVCCVVHKTFDLN